MTLRYFDFFITALERFSDFDQLALLGLDLALSLLVGLFFALEAAKVLLMLILLALQPALGVTVLHTCLVDKLVTTATILNSVLPLQVKLVSLLMQPFEFFSGLVELNLGGLSLSDFKLELLGLAGHLDGQLLNLEGQLLDFGLISASELLKSEVVFLLLAGSERPLLQLLLIPVHLQFELVHPLVRLEDHVLDVVESVLLVSDSLLQLLDLVAEATTLPLSDLLQVLFGFDFFILSIDQTLRVHKLHLDGLEMLFEDLEALLMLLDL